jgi:hypothetical protein
MVVRRPARDGTLKLNDLDDALDGRAMRHLLAANACRENHLPEHARFDFRVTRRQQVLCHGHLGKQFAVLECSAKAQAGDIVRGFANDIAASKLDVTRATIETADAIENARLTRPIRADERQQFARLDRE